MYARDELGTGKHRNPFVTVLSCLLYEEMFAVDTVLHHNPFLDTAPSLMELPDLPDGER
jgi:hypothetical protein